MRVLVTGGRAFSDKDAVWGFLDRIHQEAPISLLIHGFAKGADTLCREWALARGVPELAFPVSRDDWRSKGKAAGCLRNQQMLDEARPDILVAFPGGTGTADMKRRARKARLDILEFTYE